MINVDENIQLQPVTIENSNILYTLMSDVYTQAYDYFWEDKGEWYINAQYSNKNVKKELAEENTEYYFVVFKGKRVGNFRIIWDYELPNYDKKLKCVKLHRVYLHSSTQGKGIGKKLLQWLEKEAIKKQYELIWLDAMDKKTQAFSFYRNLGYHYYSHCFLSFNLLFDEYRKMSQLYKKLS